MWNFHTPVLHYWGILNEIPHKENLLHNLSESGIPYDFGKIRPVFNLIASNVSD